MSLVDFIVVVFVCTAIWLVWQMVKGFVLPSPLDNIPGPPRASLWKGNMLRLFGRHDWKFLDEVSEDYGSVVKVYGMFGEKMLWVTDPLALHYITIKEQDVYQLGQELLTLRLMITGPSVPATRGEHHRRQRKMLNPLFSIPNMRRLMPIFYATIHRLRDGVAMQLKKGGESMEVDMCDWMGRTALEVVGQGCLGYSFDPLTEAKFNVYADAIKRLGPAQSKTGAWRLVFMYSHLLPLPRKVKGYLADFVPNKGIKELKASTDTVWVRSTEVYHEKKRALLAGDEALKSQVGEGKDILSVLLRANLQAAPEDRLPEEEVIAQMSALTFAGQETTANTMIRALYMLSERQDVQNKLQEEIVEARNGQDIAYDQLMELPYLDAVCRETLRLFSVANFASRDAVRDTKLPLSEPIRGVDGSLINEIVVPKGTRVSLGIHSLNTSKALWGEDAYEWKPERWLNPLPPSVSAAKIPGVYSNMMTFIGGRRACLGFKFAELEMKVVLSILLESFRFLPSGKDIVWNRGNVTFPTVGHNADRATLPLKVEIVKAQ